MGGRVTKRKVGLRFSFKFLLLTAISEKIMASTLISYKFSLIKVLFNWSNKAIYYVYVTRIDSLYCAIRIASFGGELFFS